MKMRDRKFQYWKRKLAIFTCLLLLFGLVPGYAPAHAAEGDGTDGGQTMALYPTDDAYARGGTNADINYGSDVDLVVKRVPTIPSDNRESYLKFDLQSVPGPISSAKLVFYGAVTDANGSENDIHLYGVADDQWTEGALTWNNKPAGGSEISPAITLNKTRQWRSMDVTSYVQGESLGDRIASMVLADDNNGLIMKIDSKERPNKPYLEIEFEEAAADTQPPSWQTGAALQAVQAGETSALLAWPPATDDSGVTTYRIYLNDEVLQTVTGSTYQYEAANLLQGIPYAFKVEAGDAHGNWSADGPSATLTLAPAGPAEYTLAPTDDTFARRGSPYSAENYGDATTLDVKFSTGDLARESFLKFDLFEVQGGVGSAVLYLYGSVTDAGGTDIDNQVYATDPGWEESTLNWNNKPAYRDHLGILHMNKTKQWQAVDVTAYVRQQRLSGQPASFGIRQDGTAGLIVRLNSNEAASNAPYLRISTAKVNADAPAWAPGAAVTFTDKSETGVTVHWPSAQDADGPVSYRVYRNGVLLDTVSGNAYSVEGLATGNAYTFRVEAGDAQGNWSSDGPYATISLPDTKLEQVKLGNVFLSDEPIQFKVITARSSVSWSVTDLWGNEVATGTEAVAGEQLLLTVPMSQVGYFKLNVRAEASGKAPIELTAPFTVFAPYDFRAVGDSPFGVNVHLRPNDGWYPELAALIEAAGIKDVRTGLSWGTVEKAPGTYQVMPEHEAYLDEMAARDLNVLMLLSYTNPYYDNNSTPYTDEGREGFANYGKFIMEYFGDRVDWLEVYNEFNIGFGDRGDGPADSRPDYYYPLLKKTYETLKAANPNQTIAGMTTSNTPIAWLREVFELGGLNNVDVVTVHPYQFPGRPENLAGDMQKLKNLIREYNNGELKPIWLTEISYPTHAAAAGVNEKTQADYLVRTFVNAMASGVDKVFWYDLMNDGVGPTNLEHNYGLVYNRKDVRGQYGPKPAYAAYGAMTRQLTGAAFAADESVSDSLRQYKFTKDGEEIRVVWSTGQLQPVAIHAQNPIRIVDIMGNERTYYPHEGKIHYTLKDEAIYVLGPIEGIAADETFVLSGGDAVVGDDAEMTLEVDYQGTEPFDGTLTVNGQSYPVQAAPGQRLSIPITAPGLQAEGDQVILGQLASGGQPIGCLTAQVHFSKPYEVKIRPVFTADGTGKELKTIVTNLSNRHDLVLDGVDWTLGGLSGTVAGPIAIGPSSAWTGTAPLAGLDNNAEYPMNVSVRLQGYDPIAVDSVANFTPVYYKGEPDQPVTVDFAMGNNKVDNYTGPDDLSGTMTLNWDEDNFYITADIVDDTFGYPAVENDMYNNDGFQFGVSPGVPGETPAFYDAGFAMTPAGGQIYRWIAPSGVPVGLIDNGTIRITRDEESMTTHYEFALPWSELAPVHPDDGVFSFSLLLNENDGNGRDRYWEWGSGIGGTKDPKRYRTVQLIPPTRVAPADPVIAADPAGPTDSAVTVTIGYPEDAATKEYKIGEDGTWTVYTEPVILPGNGTVYAKAANAAGQASDIVSYTVDNIVVKSMRKPGKPVLSHDNGYDTGLRDGSYNVTMNMWYGDNGTVYRLYENGVLIDTQLLADAAPAAQTATTAIGGRTNGTFRYVAELTNAHGTTTSAEMVVTVTDASPGKPVLSSDNWDRDGNYKVMMNMWWGTNGTVYNLYENGALVDTQTLADGTPNAQSAVTHIANKAVGTYEYRAELVNDAGSASSGTITVTVTK